MAEVMACVASEDCAASLSLLDAMEKQPSTVPGAEEMGAVAALAVEGGEALKVRASKVWSIFVFVSVVS